MTAYYNEKDPKAAAWLRELIKAGAIAPGEVDERSIVDVSASDVRGFTQCHWFAGIGVWSYSLRRAGVRDDQRVWTASLPCQPFSAAGKQKGFDDERHLWPVFEQLVAQSDVAICYGEQVASKAVNEWLDAVSIDMEALGFAFGALAFPAAGIGAPHIRDRTYWVAAKPGALADAASVRLDRRRASGASDGRDAAWLELERLCDAERVADALRAGSLPGALTGVHRGEEGSGTRDGESERYGSVERLADADNARLEGRQRVRERAPELAAGSGSMVDSASAGSPTNGFWADPDWLLCRDGKWRPVEPIHVKMVDGPSPFMGYLRSGNNAQAHKINDKDVQALLSSADEKESERKAGGQWDVQTPTALRPSVHGEGDGRCHQGTQRAQQPPAIGETREGPLRGVPAHETAGEIERSPCGREPHEQRSVELSDVVQLMSPSSALAEFHGDWRTAQSLQALREAIYEEGALWHASHPIKAVWESLGEEAKGRIRMGFDASRWEIVVPSPLAKGARARVPRLKGFGNALCAEAARIWIEVSLEAVEEING